MDWTDNDGNNIYHFDIGAFNWHIGTWRQLMKVVPAVGLVRKYNCKSVVDIGCGAGDIKNVLSHNDAMPDLFCGVDISIDAKLDVLCDSTKLPIKRNSIDLVTSIDLLQNVPHYKRKLVLNEIDRITAPDGLVYLFFRTDNFETDFDNESHNIGGCNYLDIINYMRNFNYVTGFGVNSVPCDDKWESIFPYEFNRIFHSLKDFEYNKFLGMVMKKW